MIDVVFQLLIFFIVTLRHEDILAHLDVTRPAPEREATPEDNVDDLFKVTVYKDGYVLDGRIRNLEGMDKALGRVAKYSSKITVIVQCTADSKHGDLIKFLDLCAKHSLRNISVFSL